MREEVTLAADRKPCVRPHVCAYACPPPHPPHAILSMPSPRALLATQWMWGGGHARGVPLFCHSQGSNLSLLAGTPDRKRQRLLCRLGLFDAVRRVHTLALTRTHHLALWLTTPNGLRVARAQVMQLLQLPFRQDEAHVPDAAEPARGLERGQGRRREGADALKLSFSELRPSPSFSAGSDHAHSRRAGNLHEQTTTGGEMLAVAKLALRLQQHCLTGSSKNKRHAMKYVELLRKLLPYKLGAAEVLSEIYTDNATMLDSSTLDTHIREFLNLIKNIGPHAKYFEFLASLCRCEHQPVRKNQNMVLKELLSEDHRDVLLHLKRNADGRIFISGAESVFRRVGEWAPGSESAPGGSEELTQWITRLACPDLALLARSGQDPVETAHAPRQLLGYLQSQLELFATLVAGRSPEATRKISKLLPYPLLLCTINTLLHEWHNFEQTGGGAQIESEEADRVKALQNVCTPLLKLTQCLYVDAEPHALMARINVIRPQSHIKSEAISRA